jgi:alpha-N-arabinofuranosidase
LLYQQRNGTIYFEGEYAATSTNSSDIYGLPQNGRLIWPTVQSAVGEAVFMTGFERNADIVFAASYAPLLQVSDRSYHGRWWTRINALSFEWFSTSIVRSGYVAYLLESSTTLHVFNTPHIQTPDLISFDASRVYRSTSYYVQKLFSLNKGAEYLPSTLPTGSGTVFWSVTREEDTVLIKVSI